MEEVKNEMKNDKINAILELFESAIIAEEFSHPGLKGLLTKDERVEILTYKKYKSKLESLLKDNLYELRVTGTKDGRNKFNEKQVKESTITGITEEQVKAIEITLNRGRGFAYTVNALKMSGRKNGGN